MAHKAKQNSPLHGRPRPAVDIADLKKAMPALAHLFEQMSLGENPEPLDVFAALSQMVAHTTEPDHQPYDKVCDLLKLAGTRCISCS